MKVVIRHEMLTRFERGIINVDRVKDIPEDYYGPMGVPITFMDKWCKNQFELLDSIRPQIDGRALYQRIVIRRVLSKAEVTGLNIVWQLISSGMMAPEFLEVEIELQD